MSKPNIKRVIYNKPATIVIWDDGTKIVVKCHPEDKYSKRKGLLLCIAKKLMGHGYYDQLIEHGAVKEGKKFDWKGFIAGDFCVLCKSKEAAKSFCNQAHSRGMKWHGGRSLAEYTYFDSDPMCYLGRSNRSMTYSSLEYEQRERKKIIEWKPRKKKFDWEAFMTEKIAVECKTGAEAEDFVRRAKKRIPSAKNHGAQYYRSTRSNSFLGGNWGYSNCVTIYAQHGYKIIPWSEYMEV